VTTEVATAAHVELALEFGVDVIWIGARTTVSPFAVQEIANSLRGVDVPVMVKNPVSVDLSLWIGALERIAHAGVTKLAAIHRGFSTGVKSKYRNEPMWQIPIELKRLFPNLAIFCDPSHIGGRRDAIEEISRQAIDFGMQGLMIETHHEPDAALSDAMQQVTPARLLEIISRLPVKSDAIPDISTGEAVESHRREIDLIDLKIIKSLSERMSVVRKIGEIKRQCNITPLQLERFDELYRTRIKTAEEFGISAALVDEVFRSIHVEALKQQSSDAI
jgi:chorismate mutase